MNNKDIQQLIDRYLEGENSPEEERLLAQELQRDNLPEDWQAIRLMLGELAMGEAEYDAIMAQRSTRSSALLVAIRIISSMAAVYLVGLFLWLQTAPTNKTEVAYNIINKVEKQQPAPTPSYCTEGTPREILMCYLEHRQAQPNTYSQLKQKRYENK